MQKKYVISCCAQCPAYAARGGRLPRCANKDREIETPPDNPIDIALVGFPEWCPLDAADACQDVCAGNYKKEVEKIVGIMRDGVYLDPLQEASHYLNSVVENAKKKAG